MRSLILFAMFLLPLAAEVHGSVRQAEESLQRFATLAGQLGLKPSPDPADQVAMAKARLEAAANQKEKSLATSAMYRIGSDLSSLAGQLTELKQLKNQEAERAKPSAEFEEAWTWAVAEIDRRLADLGRPAEGEDRQQRTESAYRAWRSNLALPRLRQSCSTLLKRWQDEAVPEDLEQVEKAISARIAVLRQRRDAPPASEPGQGDDEGGNLEYQWQRWLELGKQLRRVRQVTPQDAFTAAYAEAISRLRTSYLPLMGSDQRQWDASRNELEERLGQLQQRGERILQRRLNPDQNSRLRELLRRSGSASAAGVLLARLTAGEEALTQAALAWLKDLGGNDQVALSRSEAELEGRLRLLDLVGNDLEQDQRLLELTAGAPPGSELAKEVEALGQRLAQQRRTRDQAVIEQARVDARQNLLRQKREWLQSEQSRCSESLSELSQSLYRLSERLRREQHEGRRRKVDAERIPTEAPEDEPKRKVEF